MALFDIVRIGKRANASPSDSAAGIGQAGEQTVVLRRCAQWRKVFSGTEVAYPADALRYPPVAAWIRRRGLSIEACSADGLSLTLSAGVRPARVVFRCAGAATGAISHAMSLGCGQFVVASQHDVATVGASAQRPQRVLVDVTTGPVDDLAAAILADGRLDLVGVHTTIDGAHCCGAIEHALEQMSYLRHHDGMITTRLHLAILERPAGSTLSSLAGAIRDAVAQGCARRRFPRPEPVLAPDLAVLTDRR